MTAMFLARRAAFGAALWVAVGLSYFLPAVPVLIDVGAPLMEAARTIIGNETPTMMILAVALTVSQRWIQGPVSRVAVPVLVIAVTFGVTRFPVLNLTPGWFEMDGANSARAQALFTMWHLLAAGALLAVYFDRVRRVHASAGRLRAAQFERQRVEREVLESRLNVMRARVDPVFLFEALGEVRRAYGRDPDAAERLLQDLIRFLRASLPESRDRGSTLGDEVALAAAYLKVVSALRGTAFRLQAEISEGLRLAFFPPMVLLPLVDDAVRRARACLPHESTIVVRAMIENGAAHVLVEDGAEATLDPPPNLDALRVTLLAFMGSARVASRSNSSGCTVALEYPMPPQVPRREAA